MLPDSAAQHRTIMAVDIAGYNDPKRAMIHRRAVHEGFWGLMRRSFADAGIPWDVCFVENTGDGAMIQLPAQVARRIWSLGCRTACSPSCAVTTRSALMPPA